MVNQKQYIEYLKSYVWQRKAMLKILLSGGLGELEIIYWQDMGHPLPTTRIQCERCHIRVKRKRIHVHHLHYRNIYHEKPEDLVVLCEGCHAKTHNKQVPNWWTYVDAGYLDPEWMMEDGAAPMSLVVAEFLDNSARRFDRLKHNAIVVPCDWESHRKSKGSEV